MHIPINGIIKQLIQHLLSSARSTPALTEQELRQKAIVERRLQQQRQNAQRAAPEYQTSNAPITKSRQRNAKFNPATGAILDSEGSVTKGASASTVNRLPIHLHAHAIAMNGDLPKLVSG